MEAKNETLKKYADAEAGGGLGLATTEQLRIMKNMSAAISKDAHKTAPKFKVRSDGIVEYSYTETRNYAHVHGGKMQSEEKNDIVERKTVFTGTIGTDGLLRKGQSSKEERIIKRGREPRRRKDWTPPCRISWCPAEEASDE